MKTIDTCDKCRHYKKSTQPDKNRGECALMGDVNDGPMGKTECVGWDYESYRAGVYVGPKFGCIHWEKKA